MTKTRQIQGQLQSVSPTSLGYSAPCIPAVPALSCYNIRSDITKHIYKQQGKCLRELIDIAIGRPLRRNFEWWKDVKGLARYLKKRNIIIEHITDLGRSNMYLKIDEKVVAERNVHEYVVGEL